MTGLQRDKRHRYKWNDGPWVPGVTSIKDSLDKSGPLIGWAQRETALAAVRHLDVVVEHMAKHQRPEPTCPLCVSAGAVWEGAQDAAVKWLKRMPGYQRDNAADLGTRIHVLAEAVSRNIEVEVTEEEAPFIDSYMKWRFQMQPEFVNVEFMVYSEKHQYGGTADAVVKLGSELWLLDYKSGKGAYEETALQLAAYRFADWAGRTDDPRKYTIPKATRYGVLHIRPEGAELIPYQVTDAEFAAFLACRQLHDWLKERAPLIKTLREAA